MASLPPLLPTPPASLKLRDTDAVESRAPKRHRPLEPPPRTEYSGSHRHREPSPPHGSRRRAGGTPPPPPSNVWRRSRSPPYVPSTQRLTERRHAKRPSVEAAVEGERSRPSSLDDSLLENRPSHSNRNCEAPSRSARRKKLKRQIKAEAKKQMREQPETSSPAVEKRPDPAITGDEQKLDCEKMDKKNQSDYKQPETSSPAVEKRPDPAITGDEQKLDCEKMDKKNQSDYKAPCRSSRRKKMKRQARKEIKEMKKDRLLENIKKLQSCIWLLEKDGADMAEIMEFRSMLESTKKQYAETEARLAKEGSSAPLQAPSRNGSPKTANRQIWAEAKKEFREMKNDKLLENIKKLQSCIWLLEKDGADMAEIMEFRSMLESTKKQYVENEAQLAMEGSSAPLQVLIRDRLEKTVVTERNELVEEVNHLKTELETVRRDHADQLAQAQSLMADIAEQKEVARRCGIEVEDGMMRIAALEKGCLLRKETINALQIQLASANKKLTVPSPARDLMPN